MSDGTLRPFPSTSPVMELSALIVPILRSTCSMPLVPALRQMLGTMTGPIFGVIPLSSSLKKPANERTSISKYSMPFLLQMKTGSLRQWYSISATVCYDTDKQQSTHVEEPVIKVQLDKQIPLISRSFDHRQHKVQWKRRKHGVVFWGQLFTWCVCRTRPLLDRRFVL